MRNRVNPYILYYKVNKLSCNQVGHYLIGCVQSLPNQIKIIIASICKHVIFDNGSA